ncbi:MAG: MT-A70 family methyltransferase [Planctomycetota bacterium]
MVWAGENILLDGLNRFTICRRHGIKYEVSEIPLPDRRAAELWIRESQAHRRNLTDDQRAMNAAAVREVKRRETEAKLESVEAKAAKAAQGVYDVIVVDPPWPMKKIERDCRPNQSLLDYPTMTEAELRELAIPAADDCHVWLWTTHKFLPMALRLLDAWGLRYVCTFVWHKPGGFQPVGLPQYNAEFALYARKGSPRFLETKAFPVCFNAPRGRHSEKPFSLSYVIRHGTPPKNSNARQWASHITSVVIRSNTCRKIASEYGSVITKNATFRSSPATFRLRNRSREPAPPGAYYPDPTPGGHPGRCAFTPPRRALRFYSAPHTPLNPR